MMRTDLINTITTQGKSFMGQRKCLCVNTGKEFEFSGIQELYARLLKEKILNAPLENFKRFDELTKKTVLCAALALDDAGFVCQKGKKYRIGILGTNREGALSSNLAYFSDYIRSGRKMGRGGLFIYTLASSGLAEAAIYFGLEGPVSYLAGTEDMPVDMSAQEQLMLERPEVDGMMTVCSTENEMTCSLKLKAGIKP